MGLRALEEALDKIDEKTIFTEELWKMAEFLLKSNYFKFGNKRKQIFETVIRTEFAPYHMRVFSNS